MKITGFKRPNPKQFEYKPLYYDPRKEELEQVIEQYENPEEARKVEKIRERIEKRWDIHRNHKGKNKTSNITLLLYLLVIFAIVYVLFFSELF
ncbi:MAG: hypothetical protein R6T91_08060 [Bacteroidales bacterium]